MRLVVEDEMRKIGDDVVNRRGRGKASSHEKPHVEGIQVTTDARGFTRFATGAGQSHTIRFE